MASPGREDAIHLSGEIRPVSTPTARDSNVNRTIQLALIENFNPPTWAQLKYALRCTLVASFTSFLLDFKIGVQSETITTIKKDQELVDKHVDRLTLILHIFTLLGSMFAGWTADRIGRQLTIFLVGFISFLGPLFMGFAFNNFIILLGHIIAHIGVGYALIITPIYVAEVSPTFYRGCFTSFPEVFINASIALGYACNYIFSKINFNGWRLMLCDGAISLVLLTIMVLAMLEYSRWLIMQGKLLKAKRVLAKISASEEEAQLQFENIKAAAGIPPKWNDDVVIVPSKRKGVWQDLLRHPSPSVRYMLLCAIMIQLFQKASGIDIILFYIARFLEKASLTSSNEKILLTILVEVAKTICILVAILLLDKLGQRRLLLSNIGGMIMSLVILKTCLMKIDQINTKHIDDLNDMKQMWVAKMWITSLLLYIASFSLGMGPVTLVFNSEVFPLKLRTQGCGIAFAANQGASALISSILLALDKPMPLSEAAFSFAVVSIIAWVVFFITMPETKGWSLEETGQFFGE